MNADQLVEKLVEIDRPEFPVVVRPSRDAIDAGPQDGGYVPLPASIVAVRKNADVGVIEVVVE